MSVFLLGSVSRSAIVIFVCVRDNVRFPCTCLCSVRSCFAARSRILAPNVHTNVDTDMERTWTQAKADTIQSREQETLEGSHYEEQKETDDEHKHSHNDRRLHSLDQGGQEEPHQSERDHKEIKTQEEDS